ncbi:hypothetical protein [Rossellomorea sp. BNER]|uniref:hypothetical protein n=1 Tax=Rossellomorea sp. BNER TaxID=2962031 RepID=UPI003AF26FFE|nr:hypothetical protein [Rossellomorea sp. BNER]
MSRNVDWSINSGFWTNKWSCGQIIGAFGQIIDQTGQINDSGGNIQQKVEASH